MLDSLGRWFLRESDYRVFGLCVLAVVVLFIVWRRTRFKSWPSKDDFLVLVLSLLGIVGALPICAAFLLTKPPAIEMLPGSSLAAIGVLVPVVTFTYGVPRLRALFFPKEVELTASLVTEAEKAESQAGLSFPSQVN